MSYFNRNSWKLLLMSIMMILTLAACGGEPAGGDADEGNGEGSEDVTTLERAQERGFVDVGFANERPYAYATSSGELTGLNVEIAKAVFAKLGIEEVDGTLAQFGSLIPGLQAERFDVVTAGMYITPDRCEQATFAEPEYSIGEGLAVQEGNPLNLNSYEDIIDNPDATIGIMTGAIEETYLKDMGIADGQIQSVSDNASAIEALKAGRVDAITMTGPSLQQVLDTHGDEGIERVMDFTQPVIDGESIRGYGSAVFRHEDTDFVEAYNEGLQELKDSGELLEIYEEFGFTEEELPGDVTTESLCAPAE
ncbi:ectoine/hydroxyectoine ABC transporter substrate-binding protein EhuB [Caldalkalibacillus salinus]|uniref:ectoine/hydroxyectoine ABC transporter substrate-binding protein EhuB n=1 Tax=Caldalkalibacillus salinus TaxID=2803787 RepID=UPI001920FE8D|nr:ectoine/hydroxyectoine ABC transporter substrate-binding protein EhuB [Caldalkalibacillus salinus]